MRIWPEMGLTEEAYWRRLAKGAKVALKPLDLRGEEDVRALLSAYLEVLREAERGSKAERLTTLLVDPAIAFLMVEPAHQQTAQEVSTE